ncbi:hypothetical protein [uncultured Mediterranean phage uvMED]|nr:hypothetical protein [uncultured Mediterranean phage uvMED]
MKILLQVKNGQLIPFDQQEVENIASLQEGAFLECEVFQKGERKPGKWSMTRLWRSWMKSTSDYMAFRGAIMPLFVDEDGNNKGTRPFNSDDAHELFTVKYNCQINNERKSWKKSGDNILSKSERYHCLTQHEIWMVERGIHYLNPKDSEFQKLKESENK